MAFLIVQKDRRDVDRHELDAVVVIGRSPECDVVIRDSRVSRRHCRIERMPDGTWRVTDLDSRNGVTIRGRQVRQATLADGDRVWLGKGIRLRFGRGPLPRRRPSDPIEALAQVALASAGGSVRETRPPTPMPRSWDLPGSPSADELSSGSAGTGLDFNEPTER